MHTTQATVARLIAMFLLAAAPIAAAQDARGTISGTVVDASKSLVPGASVTATNIAMGTTMASRMAERTIRPPPGPPLELGVIALHSPSGGQRLRRGRDRHDLVASPPARSLDVHDVAFHATEERLTHR